jgi:hypothetical protein
MVKSVTRNTMQHLLTHFTKDMNSGSVYRSVGGGSRRSSAKGSGEQLTATLGGAGRWKGRGDVYVGQDSLLTSC